jgi:aldose 1-epimerase
MEEAALHSVAESNSFGRTQGRTARLFTLESDLLRVCITDYGGILVSLEAFDRSGTRDHLVLGFDDVSGYVDNRGSFGALLGRNANRIAEGRINIDGHVYELSKNENGATLHGGADGFGKRFWSVTEFDARRLTLRLVSGDGDQGFPGEITAEATWSLDGADLLLTFAARTSKPTPLSLSAHPYFNLDGPLARDCLDHQVEIFAESYLPTDRRQIPTGEVTAVADTPFDFRRARSIGERIREWDEQLRCGRGYDHYFVLSQVDPGSLRPAARVRSARSGRLLEILTTQPGLQFYTGNNLDGSAPGRGGLYRQSAGFAFEPQGFPNAPNQLNFPSTILRPGEIYRQTIVYRLAADHQKDAR